MSTIHPDNQCLQWIIGKWESFEACGEYPTLKDFTYREIFEVESRGQPLLNYYSNTNNCETGAPMHLERGFLKVKPGTNHVAWISSQSFGISTVEEGSVKDHTLDVETTSIARLSFNKRPFVVKYQRKYWLEGDVLNYELLMETKDTPLAKHLSVKFHKIQ